MSFKFQPRSGKEVLEAAPRGTEIFRYSDLCQIDADPVSILLSLPVHSIILLQDPRNMNSGHWVALSRNNRKKEMYFFSSYGGKPDAELNEWIGYTGREVSGQGRLLLNDGLKGLAYEGWTIYYNDYPYQVKGDKTATCGIWATAFLNSGLNPDEFEDAHGTEDYYYRKYFC